MHAPTPSQVSDEDFAEILAATREFVRTRVVPREAAIMDGAGRLRILVTMFIPMSGSVISALAILVASTYWNDFMSPSVFLVSPEKMTIPVGLVQLQNAFGSAPTLNVFAGTTLVVAPLFVLFLIVQPYLTKGVAMQGISR